MEVPKAASSVNIPVKTRSNAALLLVQDFCRRQVAPPCTTNTSPVEPLHGVLKGVSGNRLYTPSPLVWLLQARTFVQDSRPMLVQVSAVVVAMEHTDIPA